MKMDKEIIITDYGEKVEALTPMILSVSRATDVPAFYCEWFFNRLRRGYCRWKNPFNGKDSYVSFSNVRFIVFWSKNPTPLIPYLKYLKERGIKCYVQFTLNDYEKEGLEPGVPSLEDRINTFRELAYTLGRESVVWRFDPMILTDTISEEILLEKVAGLAPRLKDLTEKQVFSFADIASYRKVGKNLHNRGINYEEWNESRMMKFARELAILNDKHHWNLKFATCAEKIDLSSFRIEHNKCIDDMLIARLAWNDKVLMEHTGIKIFRHQESLFGIEYLPSNAILLGNGLYAQSIRRSKDSGQRQLCGCIAAKDIGSYDSCPHGCAYCYANKTATSASTHYNKHNPLSDIIIP